MLCPICKIDMELIETEKRCSIGVDFLHCRVCNINYERHMICNEIGLVKYDKIFRIDKEGYLHEA